MYRVSLIEVKCILLSYPSSLFLLLLLLLLDLLNNIFLHIHIHKHLHILIIPFNLGLDYRFMIWTLTEPKPTWWGHSIPTNYAALLPSVPWRTNYPVPTLSWFYLHLAWKCGCHIPYRKQPCFPLTSTALKIPTHVPRKHIWKEARTRDRLCYPLLAKPSGGSGTLRDNQRSPGSPRLCSNLQNRPHKIETVQRCSYAFYCPASRSSGPCKL